MAKAPGNRLTTQQREAIGSTAGIALNISQLARKFKCTPETIQHWRKIGLDANPDYSDASGRGRDPAITQPTRDLIRKNARKGMQARKISQGLKQRNVPCSSTSSVLRVLHSGRRPLYYTPVQRGKVLSEVNKSKRLEFCKGHLHSQFRTWVFTDAKDVYLYKDKNGNLQWRWQELNSAPKGLGGSPWHFRFYAAIAYGHKSKLYFVPPTPKEGTRQRRSTAEHTAQTYVDMLGELRQEVEAWYAGGRRYRILHDNAPQHTAQLTRDYISVSALPMLEDYPPQAWDINVIENVWGVLNNNLQGCKARGTSGWLRAIKKAWDEIDISTANALVGGVGERLQKIVEAGGAWVKHH
jgi:hypothetical protein